MVDSYLDSKSIHGGTPAVKRALQWRLSMLGPSKKTKADLDAEYIAKLRDVFRDKELWEYTITLLRRKEPKGTVCGTFVEGYGIKLSTKTFLDVITALNGGHEPWKASSPLRSYPDFGDGSDQKTGPTKPAASQKSASDTPPSPGSDSDLDTLFVRFRIEPEFPLQHSLRTMDFCTIPGSDKRFWVGKGDIDDILTIVQGHSGAIFDEDGAGLEFFENGMTEECCFDEFNEDDDDESDEDADVPESAEAALETVLDSREKPPAREKKQHPIASGPVPEGTGEWLPMRVRFFTTEGDDAAAQRELSAENFHKGRGMYWEGHGHQNVIRRLLIGTTGHIVDDEGNPINFDDGTVPEVTPVTDASATLSDSERDQYSRFSDAGDDAAPVENVFDSDADVPHETALAPSADAADLPSETITDVFDVVAESGSLEDDSTGQAEPDTTEDSADEIATPDDDDRDLTDEEMDVIFKSADLDVVSSLTKNKTPYTRVSGKNLVANSQLLDDLSFKPIEGSGNRQSRINWKGDHRQSLARALRKAA